MTKQEFEMSQEEEDINNINKIIQVFNDSQNNCEPSPEVGWPMHDVWNLSQFGFAYVVTKTVPSRYLRTRALRRLLVKTKNNFVFEQINTYLQNDKEWDSDVADKLAFDLEDAKNKLSKLNMEQAS